MEPTSPTPRRVPFFWIGVAFFILGPILYTIQCQLGYLEMVPWYFPVLASIGVLSMAASYFQRGGVLRGIGLALFLVFCGLQWFFFTVLSRTPDYHGPVQVGGRFPAFAAALADGTAFTNADLDTGGPTVLLFFRGRW